MKVAWETRLLVVTNTKSDTVVVDDPLTLLTQPKKLTVFQSRVTLKSKPLGLDRAPYPAINTRKHSPSLRTGTNHFPLQLIYKNTT